MPIRHTRLARILQARESLSAFVAKVAGESPGVYWVDGALTMSDDLALGFALGLGPSDRALLALAFGSVFAFAFGLPLGGSVEDAGCKSLGGSSGFHVLRSGERFANWPR